MRESAAITIINALTEAGAKVVAYDPKARTEAKEYYLKDNANVSYVESKYDALHEADALILITEWKEFRSPDFYEIRRVRDYGVEYYQIGVQPLQVKEASR